MKKIFGWVVLMIMAAGSGWAQEQGKILVFSKTAGYHHASIPAGIAAIRELGQQHHFQVDTTTAAEWFTTKQLGTYKAVVFLNTSGEVFDSTQKAAFIAYIRQGGGYMGIHAASTTEYNWPWYGQLAGAWFNGHPKPQEAVVTVTDIRHIAVSHLPARWRWTDEWYNFKALPANVRVLLEVDETTYNGGKHGAFHPVAWCGGFDGGRSFYTALGHSTDAWRDTLFLQHILGGIRYAMGDE
ncbi:ThuA domain-containing protein [Chitinophaga sp. Mgbs1]|uniref:ThuA domain-containing protein n=1 Tax=Chitinophaga solisilvae TaxID=1233460 RepID=A0A3S1B1A6_9BACT|nr:ThuA domain-containing protein [Chitinophaga solisilvae]